MSPTPLDDVLAPPPNPNPNAVKPVAHAAAKPGTTPAAPPPAKPPAPAAPPPPVKNTSKPQPSPSSTPKPQDPNPNPNPNPPAKPPNQSQKLVNSVPPTPSLSATPTPTPTPTPKPKVVKAPKPSKTVTAANGAPTVIAVDPPSKGVPTGAIVAAAIGGVLVLAFVVYRGWMVWKRRSSRWDGTRAAPPPKRMSTYSRRPVSFAPGGPPGSAGAGAGIGFGEAATNAAAFNGGVNALQYTSHNQYDDDPLAPPTTSFNHGQHGGSGDNTRTASWASFDTKVHATPSSSQLASSGPEHDHDHDHNHEQESDPFVDNLLSPSTPSFVPPSQSLLHQHPSFPSFPSNPNSNPQFQSQSQSQPRSQSQSQSQSQSRSRPPSIVRRKSVKYENNEDVMSSSSNEKLDKLFPVSISASAAPVAPLPHVLSSSDSDASELPYSAPRLGLDAMASSRSAAGYDGVTLSSSGLGGANSNSKRASVRRERGDRRREHASTDSSDSAENFASSSSLSSRSHGHGHAHSHSQHGGQMPTSQTSLLPPPSSSGSGSGSGSGSAREGGGSGFASPIPRVRDLSVGAQNQSQRPMSVGSVNSVGVYNAPGANGNGNGNVNGVQTTASLSAIARSRSRPNSTHGHQGSIRSLSVYDPSSGAPAPPLPSGPLPLAGGHSRSIRGAPHLPHVRAGVEIVLPTPLAPKVYWEERERERVEWERMERMQAEERVERERREEWERERERERERMERERERGRGRYEEERVNGRYEGVGAQTLNGFEEEGDEQVRVRVQVQDDRVNQAHRHVFGSGQGEERDVFPTRSVSPATANAAASAIPRRVVTTSQGSAGSASVGSRGPPSAWRMSANVALPEHEGENANGSSSA